MESTLIPVRPVVPVAPYLGGKRNLSRRLVALIRDTPHDLYAEPFVGMGGVFFRRDRRPRTEVVNDISRDVTTLFRILQRHYQPFLDTLKWQIASRAEFDRLLATDPDTLTDLERAARFLYVQKLAFGGKVEGRNFGVTRSGPARFDLTKVVPILEDAHERLCGVIIERLPFADFIARYATPGTLFYVDPPYDGCETDYGADVFSQADFERLRDALEASGSTAIVSLNDTPSVRAIFARWSIEPVDLNYRISGQATAARELILRWPST